MFTIKASIQFNSKNRTKPIAGEFYRPILWFSSGVARSCLIELEKEEVIKMDSFFKERNLSIYVHDEKFLKEAIIGQHFILCEGTKEVARGVITEIDTKKQKK